MATVHIFQCILAVPIECDTMRSSGMLVRLFMDAKPYLRAEVVLLTVARRYLCRICTRSHILYQNGYVHVYHTTPKDVFHGAAACGDVSRVLIAKAQLTAPQAHTTSWIDNMTIQPGRNVRRLNLLYPSKLQIWSFVTTCPRLTFSCRAVYVNTVFCCHFWN